jgi:hypothetical protein
LDRDGARIVRILTGRGLLLGVELVTVRDSKTPTTDAAEEIFSRALEVASASKPPWATSWIEHLSGIDAVYGSQHRHRDVPNWGVVNWAENVSYWLTAAVRAMPEVRPLIPQLPIFWARLGMSQGDPNRSFLAQPCKPT